MRTTRILTAAMSGLFLLSACGSTAEKAAPTTTLSPTTTPPTTVAATTTTTAPAPTTAATTSVAPTTTTAAAVDQITAIKQAILDYDTVRTACMQKPASCDPTTYATGRQAASEQEFAARLSGMKVVLKRRADEPSYYEFRSIALSPDGQTATVESCFWDTDILQTESDAIFNGDRGSWVETITVRFDQGTWRVALKFGYGFNPDQNLCGPRP
jgi:ABC-type transport system substrate-binding protein